MTVEELVQRATAGRTLDPRMLFRPSLVYHVLQDPFWLWCEYHAPRSEAVDETSRYDEMRNQRGVEFERAWVHSHYPDAVTVVPEFGLEALRNTLRAMLEGVGAMYQPQLWDLGGESYGRGDLLIRDDRHGSDIGPYHYRLVEIKRARSMQEHHVLQAAIYNRMLGRLQGYTPPELSVVLRESVEPVRVTGREEELDGLLAKWKALLTGALVPEPGRPPDVTDSPWRVYGNRLVESRMDLVLLAGVGARERDKLRGSGLHRIDQVWSRRLEELCEILGPQYGEQAYYVAQAYKTGQPLLKPQRQLLVPRARRHVYFDFEVSDDVHPSQPPHVYLIGCWDAEQNRFERFLARGAADEERIFQEWLQYIDDCDGTRLYHWTDYEIGQMTQVIQRWPHLETGLRHLMGSCVDLMRLIKAAVYLPVPTFSLKCVAPALGFKWRQEGFGAFDSMVSYWEYLEGKGEAAIHKAIVYNEDDCRAMWHIDRELEQRFAEHRTF